MNKHEVSTYAPASTSAATRPATVLIDVGPAVHQRAGLRRYAYELALHLAEAGLDSNPRDPNDMQPANQARSLELAFFYNRHSNHTLPRELARIPVATLPLGQYSWRLGALAGQLLRLPLVPILPAVRRQLKRNPSLYHATEHLLPRLPLPTVLTVHDLIFEWLPEYHTRLNRAFLRLAMPRFLTAASAIIAVSSHTAHDIVTRYHIDTAKIHVIHEGVDKRFRPASPAEVAQIRAAYAPDVPYLLMVGTLEPRKNHALAIRALKRLRAAGKPHLLLIAGGQGWLFDSVQRLVSELGLDDAVRFVGYAPAEDLPGLYSGADCVLVPSLYEGFGFPVLEAMACGAPVVCSDVSSLPEVAGGAALLISPHDDAQLAASVQRVLDEPGLAATLRRRGLANATRFRWQQCARKTLEVYRATLAQAATVSSSLMIACMLSG
jgi:glycosyltransferase involved in cell wall biosynthesis